MLAPMPIPDQSHITNNVAVREDSAAVFSSCNADLLSSRVVADYIDDAALGSGARYCNSSAVIDIENCNIYSPLARLIPFDNHGLKIFSSAPDSISPPIDNNLHTVSVL